MPKALIDGKPGREDLNGEIETSTDKQSTRKRKGSTADVIDVEPEQVTMLDPGATLSSLAGSTLHSLVQREPGSG